MNLPSKVSLRSAAAGLTFNLKSGGYRLPAHAEYEYAERAGAKGTYFFALESAEANEVGPDYVWWSGNSGGVITSGPRPIEAITGRPAGHC